MQWSDKLNAGFSDNETGTWLDIAPDYDTVNVEVCIFQNAETRNYVLLCLFQNPLFISRLSKPIPIPSFLSIEP